MKLELNHRKKFHRISAFGQEIKSWVIYEIINPFVIIIFNSLLSSNKHSVNISREETFFEQFFLNSIHWITSLTITWKVPNDFSLFDSSPRLHMSNRYIVLVYNYFFEQKTLYQNRIKVLDLDVDIAGCIRTKSRDKWIFNNSWQGI